MSDDALECHKLELTDAFPVITSDIRAKDKERGRGHESLFPHLQREKRRRQGWELSFLDRQLQRGKTSVFAAATTSCHDENDATDVACVIADRLSNITYGSDIVRKGCVQRASRNLSKRYLSHKLKYHM